MSEEVVIRAAGFRDGGGFASVIVNGKSYEPEEIADALKAGAQVEALHKALERIAFAPADDSGPSLSECIAIAGAALRQLSPNTFGSSAKSTADAEGEADFPGKPPEIPSVSRVIAYLRGYGPGTTDTTDRYMMRWAADHLANLESRASHWERVAKALPAAPEGGA